MRMTTEDGGAAAGGQSPGGVENITRGNREREKVSCPGLSEHVVHKGKPRELRLYRKAKARFREPSAPG